MPTAPSEVTRRRVYRVKDIMDRLDCCKSKAYKVIHELNAELEADGKYTIEGRVPADYADKRLGLV